MKIKTFLPVYANAEFQIDKPKDWDEKTTEQKVEYFLERAECNASLCHQCNGKTETDYEISAVVFIESLFLGEEDFWEEEK